MEILIPGLILVALMVYASTRIKKTAAKAFDAETIETDEFVIQKPDGFLSVIGGDPQYAFESYSKELGGAGAEDFRKGTAKLRIFDNGNRTTLPNADETLVSDVNKVIGDTRYRIIETLRNDKGVDLRVSYKTAAKNGKVYALEIVVLAETTAEFTRNIETMLDSFQVKSE